MDQNAREVILKLLYSGDFFGEMALLDGKHRSATVTAIDKVEALVIEREAFLRLLRKQSDLLMTMLLAVSRRLRQTDEKIRSLVFADAYGKFARTIMGLVHERGEKGDDGVYVDTPLSRQELAQLMGVTRQTLSRLLKEYQQSGVLKITKQRIHILDEARLQKEAL
jgi:CRP-like cAMP-binding protein